MTVGCPDLRLLDAAFRPARPNAQGHGAGGSPRTADRAVTATADTDGHAHDCLGWARAMPEEEADEASHGCRLPCLAPEETSPPEAAGTVRRRPATRVQLRRPRRSASPRARRPRHAIRRRAPGAFRRRVGSYRRAPMTRVANSLSPISSPFRCTRRKRKA